MASTFTISNIRFRKHLEIQMNETVVFVCLLYALFDPSAAVASVAHHVNATGLEQAAASRCEKGT
jgi:hypothetical protein